MEQGYNSRLVAQCIRFNSLVWLSSPLSTWYPLCSTREEIPIFTPTMEGHSPRMNQLGSDTNYHGPTLYAAELAREALRFLLNRGQPTSLLP
ncbi:hypothetical protein RchiOBHm_Chr6g0284861 [Rosa chinensis]|uniref:Uncharacterized protein n=1 Tax=Rosa chinensis TaxID=74649 RepID=A0A2P6PUC8_ROSCH|nr:hypothetical protein RchiOBHm_Chr6g0284861 [Rosa chinensis]